MCIPLPTAITSACLQVHACMCIPLVAWFQQPNKEQKTGLRTYLRLFVCSWARLQRQNNNRRPQQNFFSRRRVGSRCAAAAAAVVSVSNRKESSSSQKRGTSESATRLNAPLLFCCLLLFFVHQRWFRILIRFDSGFDSIRFFTKPSLVR